MEGLVSQIGASALVPKGDPQMQKFPKVNFLTGGGLPSPPLPTPRESSYLNIQDYTLLERDFFRKNSRSLV